MSSGSSASSGSSGSLSQSASASLGSCDDGVRKIRLVPFFQRFFIPNVVDGFRIRVVADQNCKMPAEIFRYYVYPPHPLTGEVNAEFTGVCSSPELEELPAGVPLDDVCPKGFRLDYFDIVFPSQHAADEAWAVILSEVRTLKETLDHGDNLKALEPIVIM